MVNAGFHSVRPNGDGYFVATEGPDEEDWVEDEKGHRQHASMSCCSTGKSGLGQVHPTMMSVGPRGGAYVQETMYRYVGAGHGEFALFEADPPAQSHPPSGGRDCRSVLCCLAVLAVLSVAGLSCWFLLPEDFGRHARPSPTPAPSPQAAKVTTPVAVFVALKVLHIDYGVLTGSEDLRRRFTTEVQQAVALTAKQGIFPESVVVSLQPGSVIVRAEIRREKEVDLHAVMTSLASDTMKLQENVAISLTMMRGLKDVLVGGKLDVLVLDVGLVHAPATQTTTTTTVGVSSSSTPPSRTGSSTTAAAATTTVKSATTNTTARPEAVCRSGSDCASSEMCVNAYDGKTCDSGQCVCRKAR